MDSRNRILHSLSMVKNHITKAIYLLEQGEDCLNVHRSISKAMFELQQAKKEMLSHYLSECMGRMFKNNIFGKNARREITNLFQA